MQQFLVASRAADTPPQARRPQVPERGGKLPRLAFSVKETAETLTCVLERLRVQRT